MADLGLPDTRWDDALRLTLQGMISSEPGRRLHASQLVPLFRAFADCATGASLAAFSADTVSHIADEVHRGSPDGAFSDSPDFIAMTTSSDLPLPSLSAETRAAPPASAPPAQPPPAPTSPPPTYAAPAFPAPAFPAPAYAAPTYAAPTYAAPAYAAPTSTAPSPAPGVGTRGLVLGLLTCATVFFGGAFLLLILGGAGAAYWYLHRHVPETGLDSPAASDGEEVGAATSSTADGSNIDAVTVTVDDDMFQWTALEAAQGRRMFKGSPGGSVQVPAGDYVLVAKVRSRSRVQAALHIDSDVSLTCQTAQKGEVRCTLGTGETLVLQP